MWLPIQRRRLPQLRDQVANGLVLVGRAAQEVALAHLAHRGIEDLLLHLRVHLQRQADGAHQGALDAWRSGGVVAVEGGQHQGVVAPHQRGGMGRDALDQAGHGRSPPCLKDGNEARFYRPRTRPACRPSGRRGGRTVGSRDVGCCGCRARSLGGIGTRRTGQGLAHGEAGVQPLDVGARQHHRGERAVVQVEHVLHHLALVLRDLVQRRLGAKFALIAIAVGTLISALLAPPALVAASAAAFLLSELADFAIYTPLQRRRLVLAVFASSATGLVVDSIVFLQLAFGSLDYLPGQIIGKNSEWLADPVIEIPTQASDVHGVTTEIARRSDAQGFDENRTSAKEGGKIAGNARKALEAKTGKKVVSKANYLAASTKPDLLAEISPAQATKLKTRARAKPTQGSKS